MIFKNYIYQSLYQLLTICIPIITIPIVSKALGPQGVGVFNYVNSIVSYFVLFSGLGIANYAVREIAKVRENKIRLSEKFLELVYYSILISSLSFFIFLVASFFFDYTELFLLQSLVIISAIFDITWFFQGIEQFAKITLVNAVIKLFTFISILLFVNDSSDLFIYVFIQSVSVLLSQCILWIFALRKIYLTRIKLKLILQHFKPSLEFFISKVAIQLYTNVNKTLLGVFSTMAAVGYYSNATQLIYVVVSMVSTIDIVLLPRMSKLVSDNKKDRMVEILVNTLQIVLFFTIPIMFGFVLISDNLTDWFFGSQFSELKKMIPLLSPLVVFIPLGSAIVRQYLIPMNKMKHLNITVAIAAVISIILNIILIPIIGVYGAIIATMSAEIISSLIRLVQFMIKEKVKFNYRDIFIWIITSAVMLVLVKKITEFMSTGVLKTINEIFLGFLVYMVMTTLLDTNLIIRLWRSKK